MPAKADWREAADYAYTATLTNAGWAWEFLRRNAEYRAAWGQWEVVPYLAGRWEEAVQESRAWGLTMPLDPDSSALSPEPFPLGWWRDDSPWQPHSSLQDHITPRMFRQEFKLGPTVQFVAFHFDQPLEKQVAALRRAYETYRKRHGLLPAADPSPKRRFWPLYLRALDAEGDKASRAQMAQHLFDDKSKAKKATDTLAAARKVRDGGYRHIAAQPDEPGVGEG